MTTYDPFERVRKARRQATTLAALVVLAGILVTAVVLRVWSGSGGDPPVAATPVADDGGPDLRWASFRPGLDLPESLSAGPHRHLDGRAAGFSRTELGAALAAIHLGNRIDPTAGPAVFEPTIREQVVGQEASKLREQVSTAYEAGRAEQRKGIGEPLEVGKARLAAYKLHDYGPETATVDMITAYEDRTQFFSYRLDLRWVDGDWRIVAPTGGDLSKTLTRLPALPAGAIALSKGT